MLNALERTFGVELEFICDNKNALATHINRTCGQNTVKVENYNHTTQTYWKLITDSSVHATTPADRRARLEGFELVSPILKGESGLSVIRAIMDAIDTYTGIAKVNKSCGYHLHLQADDLNLKQLKNIMKAQCKYEWVLDCFQPQSRRANNAGFTRSAVRHFGNGRDLSSIENSGFSMIDSARDQRQLASMMQTTGRYCKLNFQNFASVGTIEVRHGAGTLDGEKITNWVKLYTGIFSGFADARLRPSKLNWEQTNSNNANGNLTLDKAIRRMFKHIRTTEGTIDKVLRKFYQKRAKDMGYETEYYPTPLTY
tara:strand:+ start:109 stop:1044 length:936 start_codon:yes stop_codon:yes gene_type:complete